MRCRCEGSGFELDEVESRLVAAGSLLNLTRSTADVNLDNDESSMNF